MQQLPVSSLMRSCPDAVVPETTGLRNAAEILVVNDYSALVAVNEAGRMVGVVTENAVIRQLMTNPSKRQTIASIISHHAESVRFDADLNGILHLFRSSCHGIVPVIGDNETVVGLLHRRDVVSYLLSEGSASEATDNGLKSDALSKPHFMDRSKSRTNSNTQSPRDNQ